MTPGELLDELLRQAPATARVEFERRMSDPEMAVYYVVDGTGRQAQHRSVLRDYPLRLVPDLPSSSAGRVAEDILNLLHNAKGVPTATPSGGKEKSLDTT